MSWEEGQKSPGRQGRKILGKGPPHNRDVELMDWGLVWAEVPYVEAYEGFQRPL